MQMDNNKRIRPKQPGFVLITDSYQKYVMMNYGIAHFYQFEAASDLMVAIPDACVDILFCMDKKMTKGLIAGSLLQMSDVLTEQRSTYFGVRFLPGYNPVESIAKVEELIGKQESFTDMLRFSRQEELLEQIGCASTFEERVGLFLQYYLKNSGCHLKDPLELKQYLRNEINLCGGDIQLNDLQQKTCYSARYLNRIIHEEFGLAPKELLRILRFQSAIDKMTTWSEEENLTEAALSSGYYDQSHFIREFRRFTNDTPKTYKKQLMDKSYKERLKIVKQEVLH